MIRNYTDTRKTKLGYPDSYHDIMRDIVNISNTILKQCKIKPVDIFLIEGGYANVNLLVKSKNEKYVLKISADDALPTEVYWYELALNNNFNVPPVVHYDLTKDKVPFMYEIMGFVEGKRYEQLSKGGLELAGQIAGKELAKMHKIKVRGFGSVDAHFRFGKDSCYDILRTARRKIPESTIKGTFKRDEIALMDDIIFNDKRLIASQPRFIHGDLWSGNVIVGKKGDTVTFLDPSMVGGDPMFDLAYAIVPRDSFATGVEKGFFKSVTLNDERNTG